MITVYSALDCDQRIRMALHPLIKLNMSWAFYDTRPYNFRVVFKRMNDNKWEYSCLGSDCCFDGVKPEFYNAKVNAGFKVGRYGSDEEAIKWLLEGEK